MTLSRRQLFKGAVAFGATAAAAPSVAFDSSIAQPSREHLLGIAKRELEQHAHDIAFTDRIGIADFSKHSTLPRFHLIDMQMGQVFSFLVTHGRGSDPSHIGWVQQFSNQPGSLASSRGAYRTESLYEGKYGTSMRLAGLDQSNNMAMDRAIVMHHAWYAEPDMIARQGKLGRSEGCFAFPSLVLPIMLDRLGPGRLLFADIL
jgi:hypothetical protein